MKKVMFISSVGGHLTQLLQLDEIYNNYEYVLVTDRTEVTEKMVDKYNMEFLVYGSRSNLIKFLFILLFNCFKSLYLFIKYRPDWVVTTGANACGPMCCLAKLFGKKVLFIESFAKRNTPTVTGKLIYKFADVFVVQWEELLDYYPDAEYWGWIY